MPATPERRLPNRIDNEYRVVLRIEGNNILIVVVVVVVKTKVGKMGQKNPEEQKKTELRKKKSSKKARKSKKKWSLGKKIVEKSTEELKKMGVPNLGFPPLNE